MFDVPFSMPVATALIAAVRAAQHLLGWIRGRDVDVAARTREARIAHSAADEAYIAAAGAERREHGARLRLATSFGRGLCARPAAWSEYAVKNIGRFRLAA